MKLLTPDLGLLFWTLLSFLVVLFILGKYAWPSIVKGLKDREKSITDSLATAEKVRAEIAGMYVQDTDMKLKHDIEDHLLEE